jgi:type IV pilus assembly protein PilF
MTRFLVQGGSQGRPGFFSLTGLWHGLALVCLPVVLAGCAQVSETTQSARPDAPPSAAATAPPPKPDPLRRAKARLDLASAYFAQGQVEVALEEVNLALESDPQLVAAHNLRALIAASQSENTQAEASFQRAMQINPRDADTLQNYGWFSCQMQQYTKAQNLFEQVLQIPQYRDANRTLLTMGMCQSRAGQLVQAEQTLRRAHERDLGNAMVSYQLAEVLFRQGSFDPASLQMRRVHALPDRATAATLWLAIRIERRLGNTTKVAQLSQELRNRFPISPEAQALEQRKFDD